MDAAKREKAEKYATDPGRFFLKELRMGIVTDHGFRTVTYSGAERGKWDCDCGLFAGEGDCSHVMAVKLRLGG